MWESQREVLAQQWERDDWRWWGCGNRQDWNAYIKEKTHLTKRGIKINLTIQMVQLIHILQKIFSHPWLCGISVVGITDCFSESLTGLPDASRKSPNTTSGNTRCICVLVFSRPKWISVLKSKNCSRVRPKSTIYKSIFYFRSRSATENMRTEFCDRK